MIARLAMAVAVVLAMQPKVALASNADLATAARKGVAELDRLMLAQRVRTGEPSFDPSATPSAPISADFAETAFSYCFRALAYDDPVAEMMRNGKRLLLDTADERLAYTILCKAIWQGVAKAGVVQ